MAGTSAETPNGIEIERLFGAAIKPWGLPTFVGAFGAGILAWRANADPRLLLLIVAGVGAVLIGTYWIRVTMIRRGRAFPAQLLALPIAGAQFAAAGFALTYHGIDGGMWFALTMTSTVAGQSLERKWALWMGAFGGALVVGIAIVSGQFDLARSPAIFAGSIYVFVMAGLANSQRSAAIELAGSTQREKLELLETHNRQVETLIRALQDGLVTTDSEGRVERWNPTIEAMTGRSEAEVIAAPVHEALRLADANGLLDEDNHPCVVARRGGVSAGSPLGEPERDLFLVTDDDIEVPVTISAAPFPMDHGRHGVVAVVADVSRERGVSEMRDSLISLVSHELRTPLTMTVGFADLLAEGAVEGEDARECAAQIRDATSRLASMIEDLLTTAVIEAGELKLVMEEIPVRSMIETVVSRFPDSSSRLRIDAASGLTITGDPDKLEHVLLNLVGNALKYSPDNSPVTIEAHPIADNVAVSVTDEGIGIPPEDTAQIFDRFTRVQDDAVQRLPGTGLGLFIASEIVKAHGGEISVRSARGKGSVFEVSLPS